MAWYPAYEFEWDADNLEHFEQRGSPDIVLQVYDDEPKFYRNRSQRATTHLMIGQDISGRLWTIAMTRLADNRWRPVTCWPSKLSEKRRYE